MWELFYRHFYTENFSDRSKLKLSIEAENQVRSATSLVHAQWRLNLVVMEPIFVVHATFLKTIFVSLDSEVILFNFKELSSLKNMAFTKYCNRSEIFRLGQT